MLLLIVSGVDNFTTAVINKVYTTFYDLNMADSVEITFPLPFTNKTFTISTASIQNFYANAPMLSTIITTFWYFLFGKYIYNLVMIVYVWLSNGKALSNTNELVDAISDNNFVIKQLMM